MKAFLQRNSLHTMTKSYWGRLLRKENELESKFWTGNKRNVANPVPKTGKNVNRKRDETCLLLLRKEQVIKR